MTVEFDLEKDRRNREKHGLPLAVGGPVIEDAKARGAVIEDRRRDYGERRWIAYGRVAGVLLVCVFTERGGGYRIISLRRANRRERDVYGED